MISSKKILLTGSCGFVGKHLVRVLSQNGYRVNAVYHRAKPDQQERFLKNVEWIKINSYQDLMMLDPVDVIIHAGGIHPGSRENIDSLEYIDANVLFTLKLCAYAKKCMIERFIYFSTVSIYGNIYEQVLTENTPIREPSLYGVSKYLGESVLKDNASFDTIILRFPAIVGPCYFIPWIGRVLLKVFNDEPIYIFEGDRPFNNFTDIFELANLMLLLIESEKSLNYSVFNVAASSPIPLRQFINSLINMVSSRSEIKEISSPKVSFWIDTLHLHQQTGFTPNSTVVLGERYVKTNFMYNLREQEGLN